MKVSWPFYCPCLFVICWHLHVWTGLLMLRWKPPQTVTLFTFIFGLPFITARRMEEALNHSSQTVTYTLGWKRVLSIISPARPHFFLLSYLFIYFLFVCVCVYYWAKYGLQVWDMSDTQKPHNVCSQVPPCYWKGLTLCVKQRAFNKTVWVPATKRRPTVL